jgi:hypothetical protein
VASRKFTKATENDKDRSRFYSGRGIGSTRLDCMAGRDLVREGLPSPPLVKTFPARCPEQQVTQNRTSLRRFHQNCSNRAERYSYDIAQPKLLAQECHGENRYQDDTEFIDRCDARSIF